MIRTTVALSESTYKEARKKAIDEQKPFGQVVNEALEIYLKITPPRRQKFEPKVFDMGKIKGTLRRVDIYGDI